MDIIGKRNIFFATSGILVLMSVVAVLIFGFRPGIDFVGGTLWQIKQATDHSRQTTAQENEAVVRSPLAADSLKEFFEKDLNEKNVTIFPSDNQSFLIRLRHLNESEHRSELERLKVKFGDIQELRFAGIGPAIGRELRGRAFWAIGFVLLGISLYIAFVFRRVSYPIKSWKYGVVTLVTLFHDIAIPAGMLAFLGLRLGVEVDTNFVVALLVIMGFSVHDTIVVFDRIRENLTRERGRLDLASVINQSINQTLARSVNTSLTLILVLLALFFFGPVILKYFVLTIIVGTIIGTYSSIFIASPSLLLIRGKY